MNDKIILTDCDGVCLDWEKAFHEWMALKGFERNDITDYGMHNQYDLARLKSKRLVREFNNCAWVGSLPAFRDARSGIAKLAEAGYKFVAITSLSLDPYAQQLRKSNLEKLFGDAFVDVICLDTGADKDEALEFYRDSELYWVEDKWENAVLGADMGLKSIIIDHPHNAGNNDERIVRAGTWSEVVETIVG